MGGAILGQVILNCVRKQAEEKAEPEGLGSQPEKSRKAKRASKWQSPMASASLLPQAPTLTPQRLPDCGTGKSGAFPSPALHMVMVFYLQ